MKKKTTGKLSQGQQRLLSRVTIAMFVGAIFFALFSPYGGIVSYYKKKSHLVRIESKGDELRQENVVLQKENDLLSNDTEYIKKIAREKHGMLKKNERVYDFSRN